MDKLEKIAAFSILVGALNWGVLGVFDVDVLYRIVENPTTVRFVYSFIGLCGLFRVVMYIKEMSRS